MTKANLFLAVLKKEVGTVEGPLNNQTKYGAFTGHNYQPWCGSLRMWAAHKCGINIVNVVSTVAGAAEYKRLRKWHDVGSVIPQPGWAVFMGNFDPKKPSGIVHVGSWIKDNGDGTALINEGNTSSSKKGSQANGGEVVEKVRAFRPKNGSKFRRSIPVFIIGYGEDDCLKEAA